MFLIVNYFGKKSFIVGVSPGWVWMGCLQMSHKTATWKHCKICQKIIETKSFKANKYMLKVGKRNTKKNGKEYVQSFQ